jgi:hypothetical protein
MEQANADGVVHCARWSSRTMRIVGTYHGHTPSGRVTTALQVQGKDWLVMADRPIFYLTLVTATGPLEGMDVLIATTPTESPIEVVRGRLQGAMAHSQLEWCLDDLPLPHHWLPSFPV